MSAAPRKTMRILHVITTMDPKSGGPADSVRAMLEFAPSGYTGEVLSLDDPNADFIRKSSFTMHAMGPNASTFGFSTKLYNWLKAHRDAYDGVLVHGLWVFPGIATRRAMRGHTPYMVFPHGMLDPYFKRAFPMKHAKKWIYWLAAQHWVLRDAYRVLFTTDEESRLAKQSFWLHKWTGAVIAFGAYRPPKDGAALQEAFYVHCPEMRGKRFLLFLGRIHRKKGCDMLIESFIRLAAKDPGLDLMMAGPDQQGWSAELKGKVEAAGLSARVHWPGMLEGDVKWGSFYASEAFVLPSHQENFGIAVAEAMACGRPVLLADKVNIAPEIAADGAGLMVTDTQDGTDRLLTEWIEMPAEARMTMGQRAVETFYRRYDMQENAARIVRMFEDVPVSQARG